MDGIIPPYWYHTWGFASHVILLCGGDYSPYQWKYTILIDDKTLKAYNHSVTVF